jgi:membrane protein YqaA with SNARE-associated domain
MKLKHFKKLLFLLPILVCLIVIGFIDPEALTAKLGTTNSYIAMFFLALIGGLSVFSAIPYPLFLVTFALGGANPFILALCSVSGVMIGDSSSYLLGRKGGKLIEGKHKELFDMLLGFYDTRKKILPFLFFIYGAVSPFPNDIITLSAGIKKYSYFKMILSLSLGNLIFCSVLAYFAEYFAVYFN